VSELISGGDGIRVLMGIIINDYPITSRDGFAQGIVMDEAATSCQVCHLAALPPPPPPSLVDVTHIIEV